MKKLIYLFPIIGLAIFANPQALSACDGKIESTTTINMAKDRYCLFGGSKCAKAVHKMKCV
jgi:hypothetical protein